MSDFRPITLEDKSLFQEFFAQDPPQGSEFTFTNIFMWRHRYRPGWMVWKDCLLLVFRPEGETPFGLPPVGRGDKRGALEFLCSHLKKVSPEVKICRAERRFVENYDSAGSFRVLEDRDNSDYVYLARDLINLPGNRYHRKKNHVNQFTKKYAFAYRKLDAEIAQSFLDLQEAWCEIRNCVENPGLFEENVAIYEALNNFSELGFVGGAIQVDSRVEAFALGELLNPETAVIHIEKANPTIVGLYAAINQLFCKEELSGFTYINREQDLGLAGVRQAKLAYLPDHMVEKFTLLRS